MSDFTDAFLTYAERDRRRSPNTLARYRATFATYAPYGDLATATTERVQEWWESRYGLSPGTRHNELACMRALFKWATKFDLRTDDPTRRLDFPIPDNHVPKPIGQSDLNRLLGELTAEASDLRRAIALGAYCGMRVSEAAGLTWAMIDQEARRIYVRGKGRKERVFGLSPVLLDLILPEVDGNVVTAGGKPYNGAVLQRKINRLMERSGIDRTFHDLRKRAATLALAKGASVVAVTQAFGWSSIQTAQTYAVVSDVEIDQIAAAVI